MDDVQEELEAPITVLFEFDGLKMELSLCRATLSSYIETELHNMGLKESVVGLSMSREATEGKKHYLLQRWCKKWDSFINIDNVLQVYDGDRVTVLPNPLHSFKKVCVLALIVI